MSTVSVNTEFGFDNRTFWIQNSGESTDEGFTDFVSSTGSPLLGHQEQTYSTFTFEANGLTYRYIGSFTIAADFGLLDGSVTATGTYDRVEILADDTVIATYDGPSRAVDFGTHESGLLVGGFTGNLLDVTTDLLFGPDATQESYENLHTDATPNLPALAYADGLTATGGAGEDTLTGGVGADTFDGRGGNDRFYGFAGDDTYIIRDAGDRAYEAAGKGNDLVKTVVSYALTGQAIEKLALTGTGDIGGTGNNLDNTLLGNAGDNLLNGAGGGDLMKGFAGDDNYFVNAAEDLVVEISGNGRDGVAAAIDYTLTEHVEVLGLIGSGDIDATGNDLDNKINGNAGDNAISGRLGADILRGLGGDDSFVFDTQPVAGNVDRIVDFVAADDTIVLDDGVFTGLAPGPLAASAFKDIASGSVDADDRILYNHDNGALFFDADGSGATEAVRFATVLSLPGLTAEDFLIV